MSKNTHTLIAIAAALLTFSCDDGYGSSNNAAVVRACKAWCEITDILNCTTLPGDSLQACVGSCESNTKSYIMENQGGGFRPCLKQWADVTTNCAWYCGANGVPQYNLHSCEADHTALARCKAGLDANPNGSDKPAGPNETVQWYCEGACGWYLWCGSYDSGTECLSDCYSTSQHVECMEEYAYAFDVCYWYCGDNGIPRLDRESCTFPVQMIEACEGSNYY